MWFELTNGAAANAQATPLYAAVSKDTNVNAVANPIWVVLSDGTIAAVIEAPTAGMSAATKRLDTNSVLFLYNGVTYDPAPSSPTGGVKTWTENWPSAFNEGDGNVSAAKVSSYSNTWPTESTAANAIGTALVAIMTDKVVAGYPNWTVQVKNTDGADPFTDLVLYGSNDGAAYVELTTTNLNLKTDCIDALGAGVTCFYSCFACSVAHIKMSAAANDVNLASSSVTLSANVN
jgi:hypothetical protein